MNFEKYVNSLPCKTFDERLAYRAEDHRLQDQFWADFAEEVCIPTAHPKFDLLKRIAWEYGHSAGYTEVYNYACDLAEFLK